MPPENRTEIVAVGKTAAATDLPDRITTAFQPEQQFRLLQPPSGQKFPEGSTARGAADCRTEVAAVNPENLGEVGERGIQMVTSLDKILTLFEIVAVVTLFRLPGRDSCQSVSSSRTNFFRNRAAARISRFRSSPGTGSDPFSAPAEPQKEPR